MKLKHISFTDKGLQRNENEDSIYSFEREDCAVFIVADGMGGLENGKNASDTLVRYVAKYIELDIDKVKDARKQFDKVYDANTFFSDLKDCLYKANEEIYNEYTLKGHNSGSTLVMLAIYENTYNIFWAGDSHIYQLIDDELVALTVDDVWENDKERIKDLTVEQIKNNQNYGRLTNAFGTISDVNIHTTNGFLAKDMKFFLCSDGVYKYCDKEVYTKLVKEDKFSEKEFCEAIKESVYKNGAIDNLSFIYILNEE